MALGIFEFAVANFCQSLTIINKVFSSSCKCFAVVLWKFHLNHSKSNPIPVSTYNKGESHKPVCKHIEYERDKLFVIFILQVEIRAQVQRYIQHR